MLGERPAEPWFSFLRDIDGSLDEETPLHILGGFVVTVIYKAQRTTSDLDAINMAHRFPGLQELAGIGSKLHKKHKVYIDPVGVAQLPENYEERLTEVFDGNFDKLKLLALDPYDIALTKLERNSERDREDVRHLAKVVPFDLEVLTSRYKDELRIYVKNERREDLTLKLWIEMIEEDRAS